MTKNLPDLDSPETTVKRSAVVKQKYFLHHIYIDFYKKIRAALLAGNKKGVIIELGSGGGFIKEIIPTVKTSDILKLPNVDLHLSALKMPFKKESVNAFVMIDVLHHMEDAEKFLAEADRCLVNGGQIIMIEPASTPFGKFIWKNFHHEPYRQHAGWSFKSRGPLTSANSALPWIIFFRDKKNYQKKFPNLKTVTVMTHTPIRFIVSGGFSRPQLLPDFFYTPVYLLEKLIRPLNAYIGLFYTICVVKQHNVNKDLAVNKEQ